MSATEIRCAACERPVGDGLTLCAACGDDLAAELLAVPGLLDDLTIRRAGLDRMQAGRDGGKSAEAPSPIRIDRRGNLIGDRAYVAVETAIVGWTRVVLDVLGVEFPLGAGALVQLAVNNRGYGVRDRAALSLTTPTPIEQAAVWLVCHRHTLRGLEAVGEMHAEIMSAVAGLRQAVDLPPDLLPLGPCPAELEDGSVCGHELRADRAAAWVRCRRCRLQHDVRQLQRAAADGLEDQLYTVADLLRILAAVGMPVSRATLYRWAKERRLEPRGWQHRDGRITDHQLGEGDRPVYRLGDARTLACHVGREGGSAA